MMHPHVRFAVTIAAVTLAASHVSASSVVQTGSYAIDAIYDSQVPGIGPICVVTSGTTAGALVGNSVSLVGLPSGPAAPALFALPASVGGQLTFTGGFIASDGTYLLTGQTNIAQAGEIYLTPVAGGPSSTMTVNGNYDATQRNGTFYISAAHGPDSHGDTTGSNSGIHAVERNGGTLTGLDLLFNTGAYSGAIAADPFTGDIYCALGGFSSTLSGQPHDFNDLWVLKAADIAAATGQGVITAASADYVASIGTGFNDGINGMAFDPSGALLVGLTDFTGSGIDRIQKYNINRANSLDYTSTYAGTVAEGSDSHVRINDFALDGNTLVISAVPEPAGIALMALALASVRRRRSLLARDHDA